MAMQPVRSRITRATPETTPHQPRPTWLWRLVLERTSPDGRGLMRWQLWRWWHQPRTVAGRILAAGKLGLSPVRAAMKIQRALRQHGDTTAQQCGIPRRIQLAQMMRIWVQGGLSPEAYYKFQLYRPERRSRAIDYIENGHQALWLLARVIPDGPDRDIFKDKRAFRQWCDRQGLPGVETLAAVSGGTVVEGSTDSLPEIDLLSKPVNLLGGRGITHWRYRQRGLEAGWSPHKNADNDLYSARALIDHLAAHSAESGRTFLVQPFLRNHARVRQLGNGGLCTVRVMTLRPQGRPAEVFRAILRLPVGGSPADNFDQGGLAARVDLASGRAGEAVQKRGRYPLRTWQHHPDTGARIAGTALPFWGETLALARRAHDVLATPMPIVGWDIAILEQGPILVEPNNVPCNDLAQMPDGEPLGGTAYAECLYRHLRLLYGI